jgi:hypothetical protein
LVAEANRVVRSLRLPGFDPSDFNNPALQRHYRVLEALALHEDAQLEAVPDMIKPDQDGFAQVCLCVSFCANCTVHVFVYVRE